MEPENDWNLDAIMEGSIDEYLYEAVKSYCEKIPEYTEGKQRKSEMVASHSALADLFDKNIPSALTEEESRCLLEIMKIKLDEIWYESRACYYKGLIDGIKLKKSFE